MVVAAPDLALLLFLCLVRSRSVQRISDAIRIGALTRREQLMPRCLAIFERLLRTVEQLD